MFGPITIPFGAKMLFNTVRLKPNVTFEDVELAVGELCSVVKGTYGGDKGGFIAGQVFKFSGFVSDQGSLQQARKTGPISSQMARLSAELPGLNDVTPCSHQAHHVLGAVADGHMLSDQFFRLVSVHIGKSLIYEDK